MPPRARPSSANEPPNDDWGPVEPGVGENMRGGFDGGGRLRLITGDESLEGVASWREDTWGWPGMERGAVN